MSESRPPGAPSTATTPIPKDPGLQRPSTGTGPIPPVALPPPNTGQNVRTSTPAQPFAPLPPPGHATPPAPSTNTGNYPAAGTPGLGVPIATPGAPMNPYQSQPYPPQAPPAPGSSPRMGQTGTIPAMQAQQQQQQQQQPPQPLQAGGPQRFTGSQSALPRITVQYPQVGTTLKSVRGTYVVQDVIGTGEFGAVYECIGPFDQIYAVKMVRPSNRPYSEVQAEWAREQTRLFTLRHPNVVYIYDSFEQGHLFYLALERCDHALKAMLGTPMQEGLVIELARQTLAAVQFLHDNDVVHDDIHGGNVLITHTDRPTVKISDFGISNELRGMTAVRPNVVHHAIMAPEILASGYTSKQSDLYQVGLLLYWMLTGEPAITMDVPYTELVRQVSEGEPRKRAEALANPLGGTIAKMLRRREAFRYTSAREVWADLRELPAWKQRHLFPVK